MYGRICTKYLRVQRSPCITSLVQANMKCLEASVSRDVVLKLLACFFPNVTFSIFLVKFLNRMPTRGFHRKKETQTKREANDKVLLPPPHPIHYTSPSHVPSLISNQCSRMRAHGWIVGICQPR